MSPFPKKVTRLPVPQKKRRGTVFFCASSLIAPRKNFFLPRWSLQTCILGVVLLFPLLAILNIGRAEEASLLTLEAPVKPITISSPVFRLEGVADPSSRVLINNQVVLLRENGYFSELVPLQQGVNAITVKASKLGKEKIEERTVVYSPIKIP